MKKLVTIACVIMVLCLVSITFAEQVSGEAKEMQKKSDAFFIIVDTLTLFFILMAAVFGVQLYRFMRGGEMTHSWRWLIGAAILFSAGKIIELAHLAGDLPSYDWQLRLIYLFVALFIALGFFRQKKILT